MVPRRLSSLVALTCALAICGAAQADTVIGPLAAGTPVRAWGGIALLSIREAGGYRLATQQGTEAPHALPGIAPSAHPFDADIGPGPTGAAVIVFSRCPHGTDCRLMRTTPAGGTEAPITGSVGANGFEYAPAAWGTRLAFARRFSNGSTHVYVRPLDAGTRVRSVRMPDVPRPACLFSEGCYAKRVHPIITELALRGMTLAEQIDLGLVENDELCDRTEVRIIDIAHRRSRSVAHTHCGLAGSTLLGVSLTAVHLLYARVCPGDPEGCSAHNTNLYRYGLRDHRLEAASQRDLLVSIDAEDDNHVVEVTAPEVEPVSDCTNHPPQTQPPCELVRTGPIGFVPVVERARLNRALDRETEELFNTNNPLAAGRHASHLPASPGAAHGDFSRSRPSGGA